VGTVNITNKSIDLELQVDTDDALGTMLAKIDDDMRNRGGFWLPTGELNAISASSTMETRMDLVWCPAATTSITVTFNGVIPTEASHLQVVGRQRD